MTAILFCFSCSSHIDIGAACESAMPLRECCVTAIREAVTLAAAAVVTQRFISEYAKIRAHGDALADARVVSKDPDDRKAAMDYRRARGENAKKFAVLHDVGELQGDTVVSLCGLSGPTLSFGDVPTCPYCLGENSVLVSVKKLRPRD